MAVIWFLRSYQLLPKWITTQLNTLTFRYTTSSQTKNVAKSRRRVPFVAGVKGRSNTYRTDIMAKYKRKVNVQDTQVKKGKKKKFWNPGSSLSVLHTNTRVTQTQMDMPVIPGLKALKTDFFPSASHCGWRGLTWTQTFLITFEQFLFFSVLFKLKCAGLCWKRWCHTQFTTVYQILGLPLQRCRRWLRQVGRLKKNKTEENKRKTPDKAPNPKR